MTTFYLPDLGEGLAEAIIQEWHVKLNDEIVTDQNMVSVETAKAVVDIPAPFPGRIVQLFAKAGDTLKTGEALIEIQTEAHTATVAGKLETSNIILEEENFDVSPAETRTQNWLDQAEKLSGIRLSMSQNMKRAHQEVVQASIFEEADVSHFTDKTDITASVIRAVCEACKAEPSLNTWFDGRSQKRLLHKTVNIGLALDTPQGLLVPVIKNADEKSPEALREIINTYKKSAISPDHFQGATILLSNIGAMAGRFATPIVLPPMVAIIATGKIDSQTKKLPLSLSFDHRTVTGGEASRFLGALVKALKSFTF
jgi:2-oxoisovalerate dehydrogenase E2 component (dihydrolipoyl transacylase)